MTWDAQSLRWRVHIEGVGIKLLGWSRSLGGGWGGIPSKHGVYEASQDVHTPLKKVTTAVSISYYIYATTWAVTFNVI